MADSASLGPSPSQQPRANIDGYPVLSRADVPEGVEIAMIWAQTTAGVIGDGKLMPWYLPEDLTHFKNATVGFPVVMGRTSWEALEPPFRPLPGRENFVVTRQEGFDAPGGHVFSSLPDAIRAAANHPQSKDAGSGQRTVWILGGGEVYAQCMPIADRVVVTEIDMVAPDSFKVYAPPMDPEQFDREESEWLASEKGHPIDKPAKKDGGEELRYRFVTWRRTEH